MDAETDSARSLSHAEELNLYKRDYSAWCRYIAPRWVEIMKSDEKRKAEMWDLASFELRAEIRRIAK